MQWDLGLGGVAYLLAMSAGFGVGAALLVGGDRARRVRAAWVNAVACLLVGLVFSEVFFGWATEEELQPNIDGLSRDEVLLGQVLTTTAVVLTMRLWARRGTRSRDTGRGTPAHRA